MMSSAGNWRAQSGAAHRFLRVVAPLTTSRPASAPESSAGTVETARAARQEACTNCDHRAADARADAARTSGRLQLARGGGLCACEDLARCTSQMSSSWRGRACVAHPNAQRFVNQPRALQRRRSRLLRRDTAVRADPGGLGARLRLGLRLYSHALIRRHTGTSYGRGLRATHDCCTTCVVRQEADVERPPALWLRCGVVALLACRWW